MSWSCVCFLCVLLSVLSLRRHSAMWVEAVENILKVVCVCVRMGVKIGPYPYPYTHATAVSIAQTSNPGNSFSTCACCARASPAKDTFVLFECLLCYCTLITTLKHHIHNANNTHTSTCCTRVFTVGGPPTQPTPTGREPNRDELLLCYLII